MGVGPSTPPAGGPDPPPHRLSAGEDGDRAAPPAAHGPPGRGY